MLPIIKSLRQPTSALPNMEHFEALRAQINVRLEEMHARRQIRDFPWLYGALGEVPSDVMFICENPSLSGVEKANVWTISGGAATIEDQWCGNPQSSNCVKRFRPALCELGLKTTGPLAPGGWRCYITNVIKEAAVVREFNTRSKEEIAAEWADVLAWEISQVAPKILFTVGGSATKLVGAIQRRRLIPAIPTQDVIHYSARRSDVEVKAKIIDGIRAGLDRIGTAA